MRRYRKADQLGYCLGTPFCLAIHVCFHLVREFHDGKIVQFEFETL